LNECDLILGGGTVVDGTGGPRFGADVGVLNGRIAFVGDSGPWRAPSRIDVTGLAVAPGFIDTHAHDDWAVLATPRMEPKVSQGVTTVVNGNCGNSLAPYPPGMERPLPLREVAPEYQFASFAQYMDALERCPAAVNVASLIGHTTLRAVHVPDLEREARPAEIEAMRSDVEAALASGALGMSSGTFYPPAAAATPNEIARVGVDLKRYGGVYATHMRDESDAVLEAIEESASIATRLDVPLIVSHHKVVGVRNFGRTAQTLDRLSLMAQRQPLCLDCYPYTASSSMLRIERLEMSEDVIVTSSRSEPAAAGRSIAGLAQKWNCTPRQAMQRVMPGTGIYFVMHEEDVARVVAHPLSIIGSDGISSDAFPHPRLWGTFPRVIGRYSRELGRLSLEAAIHKMTGKSAAALGLADRGRLAPDCCADIVVFDAERIADAATYADPQRPAQGISHVFVNGTCVWRNGQHTGARPGMPIRRRTAQPKGRG
jgi:N-acyl-D-amino-acid deacylase